MKFLKFFPSKLNVVLKDFKEVSKGFKGSTRGSRFNCQEKKSKWTYYPISFNPQASKQIRLGKI